LKKVVFILASARSGSTLLDKAIGSHADCFSIGEITNFADEFSKEKTLCGCGKWVKDCPFWENVGIKLLSVNNIQSLEEYNIKGEKSHKGILKKINGLRNYLGFYDTSTRNRLEKTKNLYNIVAEKSQRNILIDSSKGIGRSYMLSRYLKNYDAYFIHLIRDGKAVLNSRKKEFYTATLPSGEKKSFYSDSDHKKIDTKSSVKSWVNYNKRVKNTMQFIPTHKKYFLRHEDFLTDPEKHLKNICNLLGINYQNTMLNLENDHNHILGGNASRVNAKSIQKFSKPDYSNLSEEDHQLFEQIAEKFYKKMGYK
jgi:hypothetical protein